MRPASTTHRRRDLRRAAALLCLLASPGCSSLALQDPFGWTKREEVDEPPVRMVAVWTDAVMNQPGQPGVRGVGGRVMFYGKESDVPITANGTLSVYAYDDSDASDGGSSAAPARKFVFLPEQFSKRRSTSQIGDSYNVWLPWDEVGSPQRQLTLIARFEPQEGPPVLSDPTRQLLPGTTATPVVRRGVVEPQIRRDAAADAAVQQASFADAHAAPEPRRPPPQEGLETFSIDVPRGTADRWQALARAAHDSPPAPEPVVAASPQDPAVPGPPPRPATGPAAPRAAAAAADAPAATAAATPPRRLVPPPRASDKLRAARPAPGSAAPAADVR